MEIIELKKIMMTAKKENPEKSKVLQAILNTALMHAKEDKNRVANENDIIFAAKKEAKMTQQSKDSGAPFNPLSFEICESFLPKVMNEKDTRTIVTAAINALSEKNMKMMGTVMGKLKAGYGDSLDGVLTSKIVKEILMR